MMESFLIYPYNYIILGTGIILIVAAFVFITRSKKASKKNSQNKNE